MLGPAIGRRTKVILFGNRGHGLQLAIDVPAVPDVVYDDAAFSVLQTVDYSILADANAVKVFRSAQ